MSWSRLGPRGQMRWDSLQKARSQLAPVVGAYLAIAVAAVSHAGPQPSPICDAFCSVDKKCSVEGGPPQDICTANSGDDVTYIYELEIIGGSVEVRDDKLGVIGQSAGGTLTRTTTILETTENTATLHELTSCYCAFGNRSDSALVIVASPSATPSPTSEPTPTPCPLSCHYSCSIDKKCSVDGGAPQDSCVAGAGEEVTYTYHVDAGGPIGSVSIVVEVEDDKLGVIGQTSTGTLSRTTTLTETTTNTATITDLRLAGNYSCFATGDFDDSVTVTVTTATPTAEPTHTPTPAPQCSDSWPVTKVCTIGKGQSASNNAKLSHCITGKIVNPGSIGATAHRIPVCRGTGVTAVVTDSSGTPTNTSDGNLSCSSSGCSGVVSAVEKYKSVSQDGKDTDRISLLPN